MFPCFYLFWFRFAFVCILCLQLKLLRQNISNKLIGFGVIGLCVFVFPLFSYYRWKDKKIADYMLTQENLEKMREFNESKESK